MASCASCIVPPFPFYPLKKSGAQRPRKSSLVDSDTHLSQFGLGLVNLSHELLVRLWHVVEGEDAPAEAEEEECAEGDEGPEGELWFALDWEVPVIWGVRNVRRGRSAPGSEEGGG